MEAVITYLIKVHLLISILYLVYWLLLRNEKFFHINRIFLLSTLIMALTLPLMPPVLQPDAGVLKYPASALNTISDLYENPGHAWAAEVRNSGMTAVASQRAFAFSVKGVFLFSYAFISFALFIRFAVRLLSLYTFIIRNQKDRHQDFRYCEHLENISPFSFFSFLVINRSQFTNAQFEQICTHEKVHIRQGHTIDLLICEMIHILLWINPLLPLLKRSVKLNLEYLADREVLTAGHDKKTYQLNILYSCLHQTAFPLTNLFSSSKLKLRIKMMNSKESPVTHLYKYALVVTIVLTSYFLIQPLGVAPLHAKGNNYLATVKNHSGIFDGYYSLKNNERFVLRISSSAQGLTLTELWTNREYFFPASVNLEFLNEKEAFPLKFIKATDGSIAGLIAFDSDVWNKMEAVTQEFRLSEKELKAFEGYYQFDKNPDAYLQFTVKDNGLVAKELWTGKEYFILPKSALEFYSQKEQYPAKFSKDNNGKVTQLLVFNKDVWKKVKEYKPRKDITLAPDKLKALEGRYTFEFQPGKAEFIQITAKADHLVLQEMWSGNEIKFRPYSELEFLNDTKSFPLKFTKKGDGTVTHVLAFNRDLWTKVKE